MATNGNTDKPKGAKDLSESETKDTKETEAVEIDDDDDMIDEEQLEEYQEMVNQLGTFPDKIKINSLSMVAEDHADSKQSAAALYDCIRKPLVSPRVSRDRKLPLVYVLDSILKNVKGEFIPLVEQDAKTWMPVVYQVLPEDQRAKLKRVWNMWRDVNLFSLEHWKQMGECFSAPVNNQFRAADGTLKLPTKLRKEMQAVLDDMQSTVTNELDKVSLERLADINPDLLDEIRKTAQDMLNSGQSSSSGTYPTTASNNSQQQLSFLVETRSPEWVARSAEWKNLKKTNLVEESQDVIAKLQSYVSVDTSDETTYTQADAIQMTNVLAASSVTASLLTTALQELQQEEEKENVPAQRPAVRHFLSIDKSLFTNEGVKQKDETVIELLYEGGLPFVSSADGKRFATQTELSNHLDYLFKKSRLEKSMERTEERGWYIADAIWEGEEVDVEMATELTEMADSSATGNKTDDDPNSFTFPADEARDRCVICGINFKMTFDNENGIYVYTNCREMKVLNDDAAEKEFESMLVHVTCWRGLGSPDVLTADETLQDHEHY
jgi:pre-mRNA cleavage complex 2 protein Pcf11